MPAQFPSSIPIATNSQTSDTLAAAGHTALHNNLSAEVTAIATKLGTGASTPSVNTVLHGGSSSSAWSQVDVSADVTGVLGTNHGGNGTTSTVGTGSAVFSNNPTLVSPTLTGGPSLQGGGVWSGGPTINLPTITDFTNSNHDHSNAAGGGQVGFNGLTSSAFSGQVTTYVNPGSAGGTFYYINLLGIKLLWGATVAQTIGGAAPASAAVGLTFPVGFFTTIQSATATPGTASSGTQYEFISTNSIDTTAWSIYFNIINGSAGVFPANVWVVGT